MCACVCIGTGYKYKAPTKPQKTLYQYFHVTIKFRLSTILITDDNKPGTANCNLGHKMELKWCVVYRSLLSFIDTSHHVTGHVVITSSGSLYMIMVTLGISELQITTINTLIVHTSILTSHNFLELLNMVQC